MSPGPFVLSGVSLPANKSGAPGGGTRFGSPAAISPAPRQPHRCPPPPAKALLETPTRRMAEGGMALTPPHPPQVWVHDQFPPAPSTHRVQKGTIYVFALLCVRRLSGRVPAGSNRQSDFCPKPFLYRHSGSILVVEIWATGRKWFWGLEPSGAKLRMARGMGPISDVRAPSLCPNSRIPPHSHLPSQAAHAKSLSCGLGCGGKTRAGFRAAPLSRRSGSQKLGQPQEDGVDPRPSRTWQSGRWKQHRTENPRGRDHLRQGGEGGFSGNVAFALGSEAVPICMMLTEG